MILSLLWASAAAFTMRELVHLVVEPEPEPNPEPELEPEPDSPWKVEVEGAVAQPLELGPGKLDRTLVLSTGALACVGFGLFGPAVFRTWSFIFLCGAGFPLARRSWRAAPRWPDYGDLVAAQTLVFSVMGFPGLAALGLFGYAGGKRLLGLRSSGSVEAAPGQSFAFGPGAWLIDGEVEVLVQHEELVLGDTFLVREGELVPADGRILSGSVRVLARALRGEWEGRELGPGDELLATSEVQCGGAIVEVTRTHATSLAARIESLLAQSSPRVSGGHVRQIEARAERSVGLSLGLAGVGLFGAGPLGMLTGLRCNFIDLAYLGEPLLGINALASAALFSQFEVSDTTTLARLGSVDAVVLEANTLRADGFELRGIHALEGWRAHDILGFAATLEAGGEDARGKALARACSERGISPATIESRGDARGLGLSARAEGVELLVGGERLLRAQGVSLPTRLDTLMASQARQRAHGHVLLHVAVDGGYAGFVELAPRLRPSLRAAMDGLRARGLELLLISPEDEQVTAAQARELGISSFVGCATSADKLALVVALQEDGREVAYLGGQVSDKLALQCAQVGISLGRPAPEVRANVELTLHSGAIEDLERAFELGSTFARNRELIIRGARAQTVVSALGLIVLGPNLAALMTLYALGLGCTAALSLSPLLTLEPSLPSLEPAAS